MNFNKILEELGEFGPWQIYITLLLWLPAIIDGMMTMMASYSALLPEIFRCNIPECDGNEFSVEDYANEQLFPSFDNTSAEYNPDNPNFCRYYQPRPLSNGTCVFSSSNTVECDISSNFTYDPGNFVMKSTIVTEFNMFCDINKQIWIPLFNSFFMIGVGIGSLIFGILSDSIGRRNSIGIAIILCGVASGAGSLMHDYVSYAVLRMIVGVGSEGGFLAAFTMAIEIVGVKEHVPGLPWVSYTTFQGIMMAVPYAFGEVYVSLVVLAVKEWRNLELGTSILCTSCAVIWLFIPESPRWLIAKGKDTEAIQVIQLSLPLTFLLTMTIAFLFV